jgi:hypothetical protein
MVAALGSLFDPNLKYICLFIISIDGRWSIDDHSVLGSRIFRQNQVPEINYRGAAASAPISVFPCRFLFLSLFIACALTMDRY